MAPTIGFLGPPGTYSEEAALLYDLSADRHYPTITAVGEAVAKLKPVEIRDDQLVREAVRIAARRALRTALGKRPVTRVHLVRLQ